ncbi:uncharacterized protein LOC129744521 [Uranotaenia lowii]|uniref:uncharacterized protein LOC129744521 n=1 Tax=Uranotaenia lowii TaxID=190385 RepID=UPI0024793A6B|nr:uncharacterized protein LOC129744521 [Uranotaenia lowii]
MAPGVLATTAKHLQQSSLPPPPPVPPGHPEAASSGVIPLSAASETNSNDTKAMVHINGVAVDHFQQNSDQTQVATTANNVPCDNSDIQGFISYSSDSSMIELNLKFRKCACNENIINISKENLQQRNEAEAVDDDVTRRREIATPAIPAAAPATTTFSKEGKSKKLLQLNKDNLNSLVNKLNDLNSSSSSCTKCRLSLDINNILNQIVSDRKLQLEAKSDQTKSELRFSADGCKSGNVDLEECNRTLKVVDRFDGSPSKAASWSPLIPSPVSPSPYPSPCVSLIDDPARLQRRHSENVERRSIGIQHGLRSGGYRKKPQLRKGKTQVEEIIIISDEFRRQSLSDQRVKVQKAKKYSQSMESITDQTVADPLSKDKSKQQVGVVECLHLEDDTLTIVVDPGKPPTNGHSRSKSKSVDDISLGSNHAEEEFAKPPISPATINAADSVELVFISQEFVQRKSKTSSDIIIVDGTHKSFRRRKSSSSKPPPELLLDPKGGPRRSKSSTRGGSLKGPAKDPRRKTTISNSNSFLTYEEPFSPETLENKDIGTMFAEASAAAAGAANADPTSPAAAPVQTPDPSV